MEFNPKARFLTKEDEERVLCFKHAVQAAMKGIDIEVEIDEFDSEYDCRKTWCEECE